MNAARAQLSKVRQLYRDFMSLPPETRELVAQHYLEVIVSTLDDEKPKPKTRYEMLMADDDLWVEAEHDARSRTVLGARCS